MFKKTKTKAPDAWESEGGAVVFDEESSNAMGKSIADAEDAAFLESYKKIVYPYLPEGRTIEYVPSTNYFISLAKQWAKNHSLDADMPVGAAVVVGGRVLGYGANGALYHKQQGCERRKLGCKTGEGYELCPGCSPEQHAEPKAIQAAKDWGYSLEGSHIYVWGHWWVCKDCWQSIIDAGISKVFLQEGSEVAFNQPRPVPLDITTNDGRPKTDGCCGLGPTDIG